MCAEFYQNNPRLTEDMTKIFWLPFFSRIRCRPTGCGKNNSLFFRSFLRIGLEFQGDIFYSYVVIIYVHMGLSVLATFNYLTLS